MRYLAHSDPPEWVKTFAAMTSDGYSFRLADATAAKLLTQVRSKRIPPEGYERMIELLKTHPFKGVITPLFNAIGIQGQQKVMP